MKESSNLEPSSRCRFVSAIRVRNPFLRWVARILLFFILTVGLYVFLPSFFIKKYLANVVYRDSQEVYSLNFGYLVYDPFRSEIHLSNFSLIPNESKYRDRVAAGGTEAALYRFEIDHLKVARFQWRKYKEEKEVDIEALIFRKPRIQVISGPKDEEDSSADIDQLRNDLYKFSSDYFKHIDIKLIQLKKGDVSLFTSEASTESQLQASEIEIGFSNFYIDSAAIFNEERFLFSENFIMGFTDFKVKLGDNIHEVYADYASVSSLDSLIEAKNLGVRPIDMERFRSIPENGVEANIGDIRINEANINRAVFSQELFIEKIELVEPKIALLQKSHIPKDPNKNEGLQIESLEPINIHPLIADFLKLIQLNALIIRDADFKLIDLSNDGLEKIAARQFNMSLSEFLLDSASYKNPERIFYAKEMEMRLGDYKMFLEDSIHYLSSSEVIISTREKNIQAVDIIFSALEDSIAPFKPNLKRIEMNMKVDDLTLENVNLHEVYHRNILDFDLLSIGNSLIKFDRLKIKENNQKEEDPLINLTGNYLNRISINKIELDNSSLAYFDISNGAQDQISAENIFLDLYNFRLDKQTVKDKERIFYADDMVFGLQNYVLKLSGKSHQVSSEEILISTLDREIIIEHLRVSPVDHDDPIHFLAKHDQNTLLNLHIPMIQLDSVDVSRVFMERILDIDEIWIQEPSLSITSYPSLKAEEDDDDQGDDKFTSGELYGLIRPFLEQIQLDELHLINASISINSEDDENGSSFEMKENGLGLSVYNFFMDSAYVEQQDRLFFSEYIEVCMDHYQAKLMNKSHEVALKDFFYSTRVGFLQFEDLSITSVIEADSLFQLNAELDRFSMSGFQITDLYYQKVLFFERLALGIGTISFQEAQLKPSSHEKDKEEEEGESKGWPDALAGVMFDEIDLGSLVINYAGGNAEKDLQVAARVGAKIGPLSLDAQRMKEGDWQKILDHTLVEVWEVDAQLNGFQQLTLDHMNADFSNGNILFEEIKFQPNEKIDWKQKVKSGEEKAAISSYIPKLEVRGVELVKSNDSLFVAIGRIISEKSNHHVYLKGQEDTNDSLRLENLGIFNQSSSKDQLVFLKIEDIALADNSFQLSSISDQGINEILSLGRIDLNFEEIDTSEGSDDVPFQGFFANQSTIEIFDFRQAIDSGMYEFQIQRIFLDLSNRRIVLDSVGLIPQITRKEFPDWIDWQTDLLTIKSSSVAIENIDYNALRSGDLLRVGDLTLSDFYITAYRDKNVPFNDDQYKPLPVSQFGKISLPFVIENLWITNGYIEYAELAEDGEESGKVYFTQLEGHISNATNNWALTNKPYMNMEASAKLYGSATLEAFFRFDLDDPDYGFAVNGHLSDFDLSLVNQMTVPVLLVSIDGGYVHHLDFNFKSNEDFSNGNMLFMYEGLSVSLINPKTGKPKGLRFLTYLVNQLAVKDDNYSVDRLRIAEIDTERDKRRSMFNYWWKSLMTGLKNSVGSRVVRRFVNT
ncbi:MAG: hypothetical protein LAT68_03500 [Cyclobacteriaceae bacterium]|nr:hypothetical protein [Cyclobacteriaceae bacterium]MCH8515374.1 hypothetical protein [Cyclobacteriaceae bacterium]